MSIMISLLWLSGSPKARPSENDARLQSWRRWHFPMEKILYGTRQSGGAGKVV
jgi:hypothetical protein